MEIKKRAVENCERAGLGGLLVPAVIPGVNLHRLGEILEFAKAHIPTVTSTSSRSATLGVIPAGFRRMRAAAA